MSAKGSFSLLQKLQMKVLTLGVFLMFFMKNKPTLHAF